MALVYVIRAGGVVTGVCQGPAYDASGALITDPAPLASNDPQVLAYFAPPSQDARAALSIDAIDRIQFGVLFAHENRVRVLEGKLQITQAQFRDALIAQWKTLNP